MGNLRTRQQHVLCYEIILIMPPPPRPCTHGQVVCGVCHSYSAHLYERLGAELGALDGMTMKQEFCDELVDACADEIPGISRTYDGLTYCEKHVGDTGDQFWSYPYTERE